MYKILNLIIKLRKTEEFYESIEAECYDNLNYQQQIFFTVLIISN